MSIIYQCPHCSAYIETLLTETNCRIFRHGTLKNGLQMNPHASRKECEALITAGAIYGCGRPYMLHFVNDTWESKICDYI